MTERRYGLHQWTLSEVEALHMQLTRDLCAHIRELEAERDLLRSDVVRFVDESAEASAALDRIGGVLAAEGCYCECDHSSEEHDDDCERCYGCKIEAALRAKVGA